MTPVDLATALTSEPILIPSSRIESVVITDDIKFPQPISTSTWPRTSPSFTLITFPLNWFLALSFIS